ncbi:MAG: noncanonical pyrimidine nucleotidase, YjjG family [Ruminococcaceae bacterium]|nr:noncanonical pyrimidine nucleotidase, YjjG family [Oscillospiraceae bacterium]
MIKAVFVDIDDTLLDFDAYVKQALQSGFEHFGLKKYEPPMFETFERINNSLWQQVEQGTLDFESLGKIRFDLVFEALGIDFDGARFETYFRECIWDSAILIEGAQPMLAYLSGQYTVCAASNGPYVQQLHRLEVGGIKQYFDYCFISENVGVSKPAPAFFVRALEEVNRGRAEPITAAECVMFGDSLSSDIAGGIHAGFKTVWYNRKHTANTSGICPDYEITKLTQIKEIL